MTMLHFLRKVNNDSVRLFLMLIIFKGSCMVCAKNVLTLNDAINDIVYVTLEAKSYYAEYDNDVIEYSNFRKSFLPSINVSITPISYNHSLKHLLNPADGTYYNVDDFASNSFGNFVVSQRIPFTGGSLKASSSFSFIRDYKSKTNGYISTPIALEYSQPLNGGRASMKYEKEMAKSKLKIAEKVFFQNMAHLQTRVLSLYIEACNNKLIMQQNEYTDSINDSILSIGINKYKHGYITSIELEKIKLQKENGVQRLILSKNDLKFSLEKLNSTLQTNAEDVLIPDFDMLPHFLDANFVIMNAKANNVFEYTSSYNILKEKEIARQQKLSTSFGGTISLGYGVNQYANSFSSSFSHINERKTFSVNVAIPLFQWGINSNKRKMAENQLEITTMKNEISRNDWIMTIKKQVQDYNYSFFKLAIEEKNMNLNKIQLVLEYNKFKNGVSTVYDIIAAEKLFYQSVRDYLENYYNVIMQLFQIREISLYDYINKCKIVYHHKGLIENGK